MNSDGYSCHGLTKCLSKVNIIKTVFKKGDEEYWPNSI